MNLKIEKCEWNCAAIRAVISLSKEWENEDLSYGYCTNNKADIIGNDLFLAYEKSTVIGYLFGRCSILDKEIVPLETGTKYFEIEEIYVKKDFRSQGIGNALFKYVESYY